MLDPLGRAGTLVPALAYVAADGVESPLKPLVGRHRPSDGGGAWRFDPLHAFALATGMAFESRSAWVAGSAYAVASLVGMQRVYTNQHWTSDVVASAALSTLVARWTEASLLRRGVKHLLRPEHDRPAAGEGS